MQRSQAHMVSRHHKSPNAAITASQGTWCADSLILTLNNVADDDRLSDEVS